MTEQRRQELFRDAEPPDEGGKFRLVGMLVGVLGLMAVGWIGVSLKDLKEEMASMQNRETVGELEAVHSEIVALRQAARAEAQKTESEMQGLRRALSGEWHEHKPGALEVMKLFAEQSEDDRRSLIAALVALEEAPEAAGEEVSPAAKAQIDAVEEVAEAGPGAEDSVPASRSAVAFAPVPEPAPVQRSGSEPEALPESEGDPDSQPEVADAPELASDSASEAVEEEGPDLKVATKSTTAAVPEPASEREYKIRPGDSLSKIALKFKITTAALAKANGITNPNRIRVGQLLKIPAK